VFRAIVATAFRFWHLPHKLAETPFCPLADFGGESNKLAILSLHSIHLHRARFIMDVLDLIDTMGFSKCFVRGRIPRWNFRKALQAVLTEGAE
jgi:hypothetical protein